MWKSSDEAFSEVSVRVIECWCKSCGLNNYSFLVSNQGVRTVTHALNTFSEIKHKETNETALDENDLYQELRCWTLENLDTLNLNVVTHKINELLDEPILEDSSFAQNYAFLAPWKNLLWVVRWVI